MAASVASPIAGDARRAQTRSTMTARTCAPARALRAPRVTPSTPLARCLSRAASSSGTPSPVDAVVTSTSSIAIDRLAAAVAVPRRARFVGMHFFSPVPVMPLVELIRGAATDDATEAAIRELSVELGKQVIVSADRPGFIVNRILIPLLGEAMRAYEQGVGTAEDIDAGARVGLNHPMGPLELSDFIGLDVVLGIMRVLHEGFGEPQFAPPPVLEALVAAGHLGQKSGRGFHVYPR
jgi:3-hydroxybutyryl-CoA dehydrogenase